MNWTEQDLLDRERRGFAEDLCKASEARAADFKSVKELDVKLDRAAAYRTIAELSVNPEAMERFNSLTGDEALALAKQARKPRAHPERDLERACSDLLAYDGWRLLRCEPVSDLARGRGFGEIGMADCLYIRYNHGSTPQAKPQDVQLAWIEWKAPKGKASSRQRDWIAKERGRGALVWLVGEDFEATIDGFLAHYRASGLMRRKI